MTTITASDLDYFVSHSDELGGFGSPGCTEYWANVVFELGQNFSIDCDPYSPEYFQHLVELHERITGRKLNQTENELTDFPVETHIAAANPYNHPVPSTLARQMNTLSRVVMLSEAPKGAKALDMGCGWGLSSEILAYCGYEVTAVDINPHFVRLVDERAVRLKLPIIGVQSNFDDFQTTEKFDLILFYECLHHALKPWELLEKMTRFLAPEGKIIMAGEPVQSLWWKHWGLRFDALSMYCMKKFGWFESGFSVEFLHGMLARQHFSLIIDGPPENPIYVARSLGAFQPNFDENRLPGTGRQTDSGPETLPTESAQSRADLDRVRAKCNSKVVGLKQKIAGLRAQRDKLRSSKSYRWGRRIRKLMHLSPD